MCGRYAASASADLLVETFEVDEVVTGAGDGTDAPPPWQLPRWNIAPTDPVAVVMDRAVKDSDEVTRKLAGLRWGLVPSWSKELPTRAPLINARLETVAEKPSFRRPMAARRCLLPADGYYEWYTLDDGPATPRAKPRKQPFYIRPSSGLMVMAGLYEFWRDPTKDREADDAWVISCCIITTAATDDLGQIHDRMPVQVPAAHVDEWLDPSLTDAEAAKALLHVPEPGEMTAYAVSTAVNAVRNDGPELVEPLPDEPAEGVLV
ncbi:SOS response-associated peptidase [Aestuariimicrobium soli]|uniref:SOS response-associated peptidase n=1 Tax=Aestuariimicrobium soli TaxID=2035834 RepID=UPI003EBBDA6C